MTYLFTYSFSANTIERPVNGTGSVKITAEGTNKITESTIYGENGAINIAEDMLRKDYNMSNIVITPMGWFKFDEEIEDTPTVIKADELQKSAVFSDEKNR